MVTCNTRCLSEEVVDEEKLEVRVRRLGLCVEGVLTEKERTTTDTS